MPRHLTGKLLNELWGVGAKHAVYREDGKWYHQLTDFPGALFDGNGYIVFTTVQDYQKCPNLQIKQDVHVPLGISAIPGYVRVSEGNQFQAFSQKLKETVDEGHNHTGEKGEDYQSAKTPKALDLLEKQEEIERALVQIYRIIRDTKIARYIKFIHDYKCQICGKTVDLGSRGCYAEAHHIKPLGGKHNGPDVIENIICVCPTCHVLLDYGALTLNKAQLRLLDGHMVNDVYINYHNTIIVQATA